MSISPKDLKEKTPGLKAKLCFLHQAVMIPGKLGNEKTLSAAKVPGIEMFWIPQGLLVRIKGTSAIIPHANVCVAILED